MGKFKLKILRRKKQDSSQQQLSDTALEGQELLTSNWTGNPWNYSLSTQTPTLNYPQYQDAIESAEKENGLPQLHDDPGIVRMLKDPEIIKKLKSINGKGIILRHMIHDLRLLKENKIPLEELISEIYWQKTKNTRKIIFTESKKDGDLGVFNHPGGFYASTKD